MLASRYESEAALEDRINWNRWWVIGLLLALTFATIGGNLEASLTTEYSSTPFHESDNTVAKRQKSVTSSSAIGYLMLASIGIVLTLSLPAKHTNFLGFLALITISWIGWNYLSVLWSVDPRYSVRKLIVLTLFLLGVIGIARSCSVRDFIGVTLITSGILVLFGMLAEIRLGTFQPFSSAYRFTGITHPNTQAVYCAFLILGGACIYGVSKGANRLAIVAIGLGLVFLPLSGSRTTTLALIVALVFAWLLSLDWRFRILQVSSFTAFASLFLLAIVSTSATAAEKTLGFAAMGRVDHVTSLTGRLPLWNELIQRSANHKLLGHGYSAFWNSKTIDEISRMFYWHIPSGHSIYIDTFLTIGLVGVIGLAFLLVFAVGNAILRYSQSGDRTDLFVVAVLIFASIQGIAESKFISTGLAGLVAYVVTMQLCLSPTHTNETTSQPTC